jgi:hypothetical protein
MHWGTSTIALDIARTSENLIDIDALTSKYSVDNDELYLRLDSLADQIKLVTILFQILLNIQVQIIKSLKKTK